MASQPLNSKVSQETFMSLLQLDPSPIESPAPDRSKELPPIPQEASGSSEADTPPPGKTSPGTSSVGLSSAGRGAIYYLSRVQRYSSYVFTVFATIHLSTTSLVPLLTRSVPASESYLLLAREVYQTPWSEPLLVIGPIAAHAAAGIALRLLRRSHNLRRYGGATPGVYALHRARTADSASAQGSTTPAHSVWPPLSFISASGYTFALLLLSHVSMNRYLPLLLEGDSANIGLAYVAHGFARHPALSWAFYGGLLAVGCGHMVWGWARWLGYAQNAAWRSGRPTGNAAVDGKNKARRRRLWLTIHSVAGAVAALFAAGGLGIVATAGRTTGWVGKVYDNLFAFVGL